MTQLLESDNFPHVYNVSSLKAYAIVNFSYKNDLHDHIHRSNIGLSTKFRNTMSMLKIPNSTYMYVVVLITTRYYSLNTSIYAYTWTRLRSPIVVSYALEHSIIVYVSVIMWKMVCVRNQIRVTRVVGHVCVCKCDVHSCSKKILIDVQ